MNEVEWPQVSFTASCDFKIAADLDSPECRTAIAGYDKPPLTDWPDQYRFPL